MEILWEDCRRKGTKMLNQKGILRGGGRELGEAWSFDSHMGCVPFDIISGKGQHGLVSRREYRSSVTSLRQILH